MKNFESLTVNELQNIYGGTNWKKIGKCYAGTLGSAVLGFGAMGSCRLLGRCWRWLC